MKRLTDAQKETIYELRSAGLGYKTIAGKLSLSRDTVRSYCKRNRISYVKTEEAEQTSPPSDDMSDEKNEMKVGNTVFVISTMHSESATETLENKLEKLILQEAMRQSGNYHFVQN